MRQLRQRSREERDARIVARVGCTAMGCAGPGEYFMPGAMAERSSVSYTGVAGSVVIAAVLLCGQTSGEFSFQAYQAG